MGPKVRFLQKLTVGRPATFEKVETFSKMGGNLNEIKSNIVRASIPAESTVFF